MSYEDAKTLIRDWLYSTERIDENWRIVLSMCLDLINEKLENNKK